tara:strand:+ start:214 stop:666 length:453 start_codon:yes stop_codon:yes gene_type:complete
MIEPQKRDIIFKSKSRKALVEQVRILKRENEMMDALNTLMKKSYGIREVRSFSDNEKAFIIKEFISEYSGFTIAELVGRRKFRDLTDYRQIVQYLLRKHTSFSLTKIGQETNRDHSTIKHSIRQCEDVLFKELATIESLLSPKLFHHIKV